MKSVWRSGTTLSVTVAFMYTFCALVYALMPERGIDFLNALFHGLDFRKLGAPMPFTFLMFVYPLIVFVVWGFAAGALYAWLRRALHDASCSG